MSGDRKRKAKNLDYFIFGQSLMHIDKRKACEIPVFSHVVLEQFFITKSIIFINIELQPSCLEQKFFPNQ